MDGSLRHHRAGHPQRKILLAIGSQPHLAKPILTVKIDKVENIYQQSHLFGKIYALNHQGKALPSHAVRIFNLGYYHS